MNERVVAEECPIEAGEVAKHVFELDRIDIRAVEPLGLVAALCQIEG